MLNKNTCEELWQQYLLYIKTQTHSAEFAQSYHTSYYKKGEYISNEVTGIRINEKNQLKFITKEGNDFGYDKVQFYTVEIITKEFFPNATSPEISRLQNTIVYLRRLISDIDLCACSLLGESYKDFLTNIENTAKGFVIESLNKIVEIALKKRCDC